MIINKKLKNFLSAFILLLIIICIVIIGYKYVKNNKKDNTKDDPKDDKKDDTNNNNLNDKEEFIAINKTGMNIIIEARCTLIKDNKIIAGSSLPGYKPNYYVKNNEKIKFNIPKEGLSAVKIWAKFYCDDNAKCLMGQSMQDWDDNKQASVGGCDNSHYGCTPPVDTIFEATFGCDSTTECAVNPSAQNQSLLNDTFFDISHVDGYTLPYKLEIIGDTHLCDNGKGLKLIDGTNLTLSKCPDENKLYMINPINGQKTLVGCMSPCQTLTAGLPFGKNYTANPNDNVKEFSEDAVRFCCPTPPQYLINNNNVSSQCTIANGCTSSENCGMLGIKDTPYYKLIKKIVPDNYAYAYDDANGLHTCPRKNIKYQLTFYSPEN